VGREWKGWEGRGRAGRGKGLVRGKRREVVGVGRKGWEIGTFIVRYLLKNVDG